MKTLTMFIKDWIEADKIFEEYPTVSAQTVLDGQLIKVTMMDEHAVMLQIKYPELVIKMESI